MCQYMDELVAELIEERTIEIAKNMLLCGASWEFIVACLELPKEDVINLQKDLAIN